MTFFLKKILTMQYFYFFAKKNAIFFALSFFLLGIYGFVAGLFLAPPDYQQGETFRIIYVHVPSAFLSLLIYMVMAIAAVLYKIFRLKIALIIIQGSLILGASITFLALTTGAIWGKPMWGTWWIWDARLTSELILLFLYLGIIALQSAIEEPLTRASAVCLLILVGAINLPIIHFSVYWWSTLHQGGTVFRLGRPLIQGSMLYPLIALIFAFIAFYAWILLEYAQAEILEREGESYWVNILRKTQ